MTIQIEEPLPQTTCDQFGQMEFEAYLSRNRIAQEDSAVVRAYQTAEGGGYLAAARLNHCLTVEQFGEYSPDCYDLYGNLEFSQPDFDNTKRDLDQAFAIRSYSFSADSVLFKGVGIEPFYDFLELASKQVGELVYFAGFLSATVCAQVAQSFASGVLFRFRGLHHWQCIVPPTKAVQLSKTPGGVEQEILLNRGLVIRIVGRSSISDSLVIDAEIVPADVVSQQSD